MEFSRASFTTSRHLTYSYVTVPRSNSTSQKPTILFLHGFPSLAIDFSLQIEHFSSLGYGIIAPDLIGYGASSRPLNSNDYKHKLIVQDVIELLDSLSINSVVGLSHDFGSQILTRLEFYHPNRVTALIFLTIGPIALGQEFNLDAVNKMTKEMLGYEGFGYQEFLTRDPEATTIMAQNSQSLHDLFFAADHNLWKDNVGRMGGLKAWLQAGQRCETIPLYKGKLAEQHTQAFSKEKGGYEGAKSWYIGLVNNLNIEDDKARLQELGVTETYRLEKGKKVLLVTAALDAIAFPSVQEQMTRPYLQDPDADLIVNQVEAGHWVGTEKPDETNSLIERFLEDLGTGGTKKASLKDQVTL